MLIHYMAFDNFDSIRMMASSNIIICQSHTWIIKRKYCLQNLLLENISRLPRFCEILSRSKLLIMNRIISLYFFYILQEYFMNFVCWSCWLFIWIFSISNTWLLKIPKKQWLMPLRVAVEVQCNANHVCATSCDGYFRWITSRYYILQSTYFIILFYSW